MEFEDWLIWLLAVSRDETQTISERHTVIRYVTLRCVRCAQERVCGNAWDFQEWQKQHGKCL
jgi:hypothetical protein